MVLIPRKSVKTDWEVELAVIIGSPARYLDQARIRADPATQRWWQLTDPCQDRHPGTPEGEQWAPLTEVWHLSR
jgi:L-rhamnose mutarotase